MATGKFKVIYASYAKVIYIFKVIFAIFKMWLLENLKLYMHKVIYNLMAFNIFLLDREGFFLSLFIYFLNCWAALHSM